MLWRLSLALILIAQTGLTAELKLLSRMNLRAVDPAFGGLSAIEISPDGAQVFLVSDRGGLFRADLSRQNGKLSGISVERLPQSLHGFDSEGLAIGTDGQWFVSLEGRSQVRALPKTRLPRHPDFRKFPGNGGLEALAVDRTGALWTLPETSALQRKPIPIYRYANGRWTKPRMLPRDGLFLPVGADFGPDGNLYILERHLNAFGFRTRIRRITPGQNTPPETLLKTSALTHGNLEGIAVWQDAQGRVRLTMVSDNNFKPYLRSEMVEYVLQE
ncbi:MAG: esterase-like activity of phytase family protein [Paracoccaceae bacterium]